MPRRTTGPHGSHLHGLERLPGEYRARVRQAIFIERHADETAHASKCIGFDERGERCYYPHEFTLTELRFDADEWPMELPTYWERVEAWGLDDGKWLSQRSHMRPDAACTARTRLDDFVIVDSMPT